MLVELGVLAIDNGTVASPAKENLAYCPALNLNFFFRSGFNVTIY
tara:strand:- start:843 stop:977 length:135 start_codon:yes stop_codon:yes gene_type:complete